MTGYKTLIVASLITMLGAAQSLDWVHLIPSTDTANWVITAIGVVMAALRVVTSTPVGGAK